MKIYPYTVYDAATGEILKSGETNSLKQIAAQLRPGTDWIPILSDPNCQRVAAGQLVGCDLKVDLTKDQRFPVEDYLIALNKPGVDGQEVLALILERLQVDPEEIR